MILVLGVAAGLAAGLIRSWIGQQPYKAVQFSSVWLVAAAVIPQLLIFHIPATAGWFSDTWASSVLVISQLVLLFFVWQNRHLAGMRIFGLGLILNLLVIILNGGLMPISPDTVQALFPNAPTGAWSIGTRPGRSKNIILAVQDTRLAWLSDAILLPAWFPWTRALSPGDLAVALGAFWTLAVDPFRGMAPEDDPEVSASQVSDK